MTDYATLKTMEKFAEKSDMAAYIVAEIKKQIKSTPIGTPYVDVVTQACKEVLPMKRLATTRGINCFYERFAHAIKNEIWERVQLTKNDSLSYSDKWFVPVTAIERRSFLYNVFFVLCGELAAELYVANKSDAEVG